MTALLHVGSAGQMPPAAAALLTGRGVTRSFPAQRGGAPTVALRATELEVQRAQLGGGELS